MITAPYPSEQWLRTFPSNNLGIMSCHWTDVERRHVVPKYPGQTFHFVDLDGFWMYVGKPEPLPESKTNWSARIVLIICLAFVGVEAFLVWLLGQRVGLW